MRSVRDTALMLMIAMIKCQSDIIYLASSILRHLGVDPDVDERVAGLPEDEGFAGSCEEGGHRFRYNLLVLVGDRARRAVAAFGLRDG